jgi:hypothetical protein
MRPTSWSTFTVMCSRVWFSPHQVQVVVGADAEQLDEGRDHVLVLAGEAVSVADLARVSLQLGDEGGPS